MEVNGVRALNVASILIYICIMTQSVQSQHLKYINKFNKAFLLV